MDVVRTTKPHGLLYMVTVEWKDGAVGVLGGWGGG